MKDYKVEKTLYGAYLMQDGKEIFYTNDDNTYTEQWTYYDNGGEKSYKDSDGLEITYNEQGKILTRYKNGKLVIDNRPKITIELTKEKFDKIKHLI